VGSRVVVVGTSLDQIDDMMRRVILALLIGGPLVVGLTAIAAWLLTGGALAPVERLRAEAAEISAADLGRRLKVPGTRDELTALARTLNQLLEELDSALRRQRHFVAAAGHELRTPLARMRAELELALRPGRAAAEVRARLHRTVAGVDRVTRVISELLVLARDDEGHLLVRPSVQDVGPIVAAGLSAFRGRAQRAQVLLVLNAEPGVMADVDELWLRHALDNLLDNALRYTPAGSSVEVAVWALGAEAIVEVKDRGPGFPSDVLSQPFQRFEDRPSGAAPDGDAKRGTGLGLWIVGMIMIAHHGRAELANRVDGGTTISLRLARIPPGQGPQPAGGAIGVGNQGARGATK
ncbi:MAG: HAMP domain-containing sensor histidine kinase, partial [Candidatus Dormibacteria bacterium]